MSKSVLIITSNAGVEHDELTKPLAFLKAKGYHCVHAAEQAEAVQTVQADKTLSEKITPDTTLNQVQADHFDLLLIPGGTVNADTLRLNTQAIALIQQFADTQKPIAAICHAPWTLINAERIKGKLLTSYKSIQLDVINAGGQWVNQAMVRCDSNGFVLITSRQPDDIAQFNAAIEKELQA